MADASLDLIRVLHVDDEPGLAEMAAEFVMRQSDRIEVEPVTGTADAVERLRANQFDCVVSDYDMPGMNGIEFLEAVREDYPDLPFILYTGKGSEEVASDAISAGVTDYLQKEGGTSQYEVLANRITNTVEKYRAQNELEVSQRRLNLFFEQSPLGVIRWDENFDLERMNHEASEILGYAEPDLKGRSWEVVVPESDRDAVDEVVSNLLEDKGGYHSVNENVRKDGERIVCEWHNRVVTDDDGAVIAIYSQFQDVTERRERERRFEAIFNNAYTFTGLMDPDGTLLEANETALNFGDVDREEVVGQPIWDSYWFKAYDDARTTAKEAVEQARNGDLFRDEIKVRGSVSDVIIDFSVRPIFDENGDVTLLVPEGRDLTNLKEREQDLRETKAELEATVAAKNRQNRAFNEFLDIVNDASLSFEQQRNRVLDLGVEFLNLDIGIISKIDPPNYTVEHVVSQDGSIEQGTVLDFSDTFCSLVYEADGPVMFHSPEDGDVKDHPCYQELGLHAYLGEPLVIDGERYGTLNFSSSEPRKEPFSEGDQAFIRTIAEWVSKELGRHEREAEIHRLNQLHQTVLSNIRETVLLTDDDGQFTYVCPNINFIFGYDEETIEDMGSVEALFGENLIDSQDLESGTERRNIETVVTDAEGQEHAVLVTVRQVNIEDGTRLYSVRDITGRKEQQRKREQIIDRVTDAIAEVDSDWQFTLVNEQAEELYDMREDDLLGRDFWEVFDAARDTRFEEEYRRVMETRESSSFVEYFSQLDGWFDIEAYPKDDGGIAFYFVEVTEHRERQRELEERNSLLWTLFDALPQGVLVENGSRDVLTVNQQMIDLFEMQGTPEEVIGADCAQLAKEVRGMFKDSGQFVDRIDDLIAEGDPVDNEELALADGRQLERTYRPIELPDGNGHLWMYQDITDRQEREQVLTALHDIGLELDSSKTVDEVCQRTIDAAENILQFDLSLIAIEEDGQLVVRATSDPLPEGASTTMPVDTGIAGQTYRTGKSLLIENISNHEAGEPQGPHQSGISLPIGTHGNFQAVAEHPGAFDETDLELAELLIERTESALDRLQYEQKLERQNDRLAEFASVVSHDLRNPLNVVEGRVEIAQEEWDSKHLDAIETAADRMSHIIEDVLSLAREGQDIGSVDSIPIVDAVDDAWNLVADDAERAQLRYADDELSTAMIEADYDRLSQLLENLLRNAIEHGGQDVIVTIGILDDGFYVEDDGPGIPADERDDVFTAGYSTGKEGTGFGLSIVKRVAEAHGWRISVTEGTEGGARFEVTGVEIIDG